MYDERTPIKNINLFTCHFIIGCEETRKDFTLTNTERIEALHLWMDYKNNERSMEKYRTKNTCYIAFLEIVDLDVFKNVVKDFYKIYLKTHPYSVKADFLKAVFAYTIYDLERFIKQDLIWLNSTPLDNKFTFFTYYDGDEYCDYAIPEEHDLDHYKQYYLRVLDYLREFAVAKEQDLKPSIESLDNKRPSNNSDFDEPAKYKAIHYVLSYLFDCDVQGKSYPVGKRVELERIGRKRTNGKKSGNTFYKNFNRLSNDASFDHNKESCLIDYAGENWRSIVLNLSEDSEKLEAYLISKQM